MYLTFIIIIAHILYHNNNNTLLECLREQYIYLNWKYVPFYSKKELRQKLNDTRKRTWGNDIFFGELIQHQCSDMTHSREKYVIDVIGGEMDDDAAVVR